LGVNYGKGLQLVNILRDAPADLRSGRCYLPADELQAIGLTPADLLRTPESTRPVFDRWLQQAQEHLDDGFRYLTALRPARLRIACFLPWYLGKKTLQAMRAAPPLESPTRIKVSRATVRAALLLALPVAFSNASLDRVRREFS
jgi:farnesyl-diphosphate farnesyltransferase